MHVMRLAAVATAVVTACAALDPALPPAAVDAGAASDTALPMPVRCIESLGFGPVGGPGRFEVRLNSLRPGTATKASLCVQDAPELGKDDCRPFHGQPLHFPPVWTVDLNPKAWFRVWTEGLSQGEFGADCFLDKHDRSFMKWTNYHDFEVVFWVRRVPAGGP